MKILICDDDELNLKINRVMVEDFLEKRNILNAIIIARIVEIAFDFSNAWHP